ncbi:stage VI sporulation protein F [Virgibacillus doumboii]|uniref:stage VI sporulation protein F n=1 Tax=Virgibacillus doumboii TaxID=2697503 RepID=UPI0013DEC435|nr:stage VI sporulation protein F [Virgibacillus doumboii]
MDDMVKKVEKKTGVNSNDIMGVVQSLNGKDLSDEKNVRKLVRQLSRMANKPVSRKKEDMIVEMLTKKKKKIDQSTISKLM